MNSLKILQLPYLSDYKTVTYGFQTNYINKFNSHKSALLRTTSMTIKKYGNKSKHVLSSIKINSCIRNTEYRRTIPNFIFLQQNYIIDTKIDNFLIQTMNTVID